MDKKKEKNKKEKICQKSLNNTDKITLQYMTNPAYNNILVKDNKNNELYETKLLDKKEEIIFFKKNILSLTKKFLDSFEKNEKIKVPENVIESFNNYLYNIIGYIEHKKIAKSVKDDLVDFENNNSNNDVDDNNKNNNIQDNNSTCIDDKYISNIIQNKQNENNQLNKFVKITNLSKKEKIIPNKKNIYK